MSLARCLCACIGSWGGCALAGRQLAAAATPAGFAAAGLHAALAADGRTSWRLRLPGSHNTCRCLEAGFDAWLAKPFRVEDLVRVITDSQQRIAQKVVAAAAKPAAAAAAGQGGGGS